MADAEELVCAFCRASDLAWVAACAPHEGAWRRWILRAKLQPDPGLVPALAACLARELLVEEPQPDWCLVPVPPGSRTGVLRGPSVPDHLARLLGRRFAVPMARALVRRRPGAPQRWRPRHERTRLAPDTFGVGGLPRGTRTVLLVDDVMTTGATLGAAAAALKDRYPGLDVCAAVLARAGAPAA